MKRYFLSALFIVFSFNANAENIFVPYIGIDGIYNKSKLYNSHSDNYGANFNVGTSYNKYFGTELFYAQVGSNAKAINLDQKYKVSYRAYGLDAVVYAPICSYFDLTTNLGIGAYTLKEKQTGISHSSDEGYGYRFGGGFIYHITPALAVRFVARYVNFDHISNADHMAEYAFGFRYNFIKD